VVPAAAVEVGGKPRVGWWRVDAATGQTLGVCQSGQGQAMPEYVKIVGIFLIAGGAAIMQFFGCGGDTGGDAKFGLCFACGVFTGVLVCLALLSMAGLIAGAIAGFATGAGSFWTGLLGGTVVCNAISRWVS
jgi:hypothetical protein